VANGDIVIYGIDTLQQQADIFTKPLDESTFTYLQEKMMGW
jgi:hypothetical protein